MVDAQGAAAASAARRNAFSTLAADVARWDASGERQRRASGGGGGGFSVAGSRPPSVFGDGTSTPNDEGRELVYDAATEWADVLEARRGGSEGSVSSEQEEEEEEDRSAMQGSYAALADSGSDWVEASPGEWVRRS